MAASNTFALIKKKYEFRFLLERSWLLEMHFSTQGTPVARFAVGAQQSLFHEVETVDLWVWFPSMICLGWWAGTTGPPRIPPSQGCEHPSVMSFTPKSSKIKKCNYPKVQCTKKRQQNTLRKWSNFYRSSRCVRVRNSNLKRLDLVLHWFRTEVIHSACGSFDWFVNTMLNSWSWRNDLKQCYL